MNAVSAQPASAAATAPEPLSFGRTLSGEFNGQLVRYRAVAGETFIRDEKGEPVASLFSVAYLGENTAAAVLEAERPIAFAFNGGPGSSAQWLHMGAFGPRRVEMPAGPQGAGAPPYSIVDNTSCPLDVCDLVFIDPVGTGYSRPLGGRAARDFWGLLEDARSIADFIQRWITEHGRWNSPRYLIAESYGTTRAALVADILGSRYIALNGVVLTSAVLDYQNSRPRPGDGGILSYASFLPTYAAIAAYHGKIALGNRGLEDFLDEVRTFARTDYAQALIANERLSKAERARLNARVAAYCGLSESYVEHSRLRIPVGRFFKELLRDRGLVIGRLDGRYTGIEPESAGEAAESDPTFDAIGSAFTAATNAHLHELGVRMPYSYVPYTELKAWNWRLEESTPNGAGYVNVVPHLGRAMRHNEHLRVLVVSGYYDLATPFFGVENALSQPGIVQERVTYTYHEVGHMIFVHSPCRERFLADVREFVRHDGIHPSLRAARSSSLRLR